MAGPADSLKEKPACGGGKQAGDYDLPLHIFALLMIMAASTLSAGFPVAAKRVRWLNLPERAFFFYKHFGTGVHLAAAFVHLLPAAFATLSDPCLPSLFTSNYPPMPGAIMMASLVTWFLLEMWLHSRTGGHSQDAKSRQDSAGPEISSVLGLGGQQSPPPPYVRPNRPVSGESFESEDDIAQEKKMARELMNQQIENGFPDDPSSDMPPWFIAFYERFVQQHLELINKLDRSAAASLAAAETRRQSIVSSGSSFDDSKSGFHLEKSVFDDDKSLYDEEKQKAEEAMILKKMFMNIMLLESGIMFHATFIGLALALTSDDGLVVFLVAILFHQTFEGLGLGTEIGHIPFGKKSIRPWLLVIAFGVAPALGQIIGLATRTTYDPYSAEGLIISGVFNSISAGLLIYAAAVDLLTADFFSEDKMLSKKDKIAALSCLLVGAACMAVLGAFMKH